MNNNQPKDEKKTRQAHEIDSWRKGQTRFSLWDWIAWNVCLPFFFSSHSHLHLVSRILQAILSSIRWMNDEKWCPFGNMFATNQHNSLRIYNQFSVDIVNGESERRINMKWNKNENISFKWFHLKCNHKSKVSVELLKLELSSCSFHKTDSNGNTTFE